MNQSDYYANRYQSDYGFEREMVRARQAVLTEILAELQPRSVIEVGCGRDMLALAAVPRMSRLEHWIIVEPAQDFVEAARASLAGDKRFGILKSCAEEARDEVLRQLSGGADLVVCSSVLHEVADPGAFLAAVRSMCREGGVVHVNVPNALSLHRRLARAMGLIQDEHAFSERNVKLQQQRVYDPQAIREALTAAGLRIQQEGGYFLKPFTHKQMEQLQTLLGGEVIKGLARLGQELPQLAAEIYVNAVNCND